MPDPLVSIIIPCFNAGPWLRRCLDSVAAQQWPNLEVIFVDNNSTDASRAQAEAFSAGFQGRFILSDCPEQGVNRARLKGYSLATGECIQWLDADDELAPDKLARQIRQLESSGADIVYGDWINRRTDATGRVRTSERSAGAQRDQLQRALIGPWLPTHTYLFRRAFADRLSAEEAWTPHRPAATDIEYMAMAAILGGRIVHHPGVVATYNNYDGARISTLTDYGTRIAHLKAIWTRIETRAGQPGAVPLTPRQRALLHPVCEMISAPAGSYTVAKIGGRLCRLTQAATRKTVDLKPREANIALAFLGASPLIPLHHAMALAEVRPDLEGGAAAILETLERLYRAGVLVVEPVPEPAP
jgi:Glycosyl transferase family 2